MENKGLAPIENLKNERLKINKYLKLMGSLKNKFEKNTVSSLKSALADLKKAESILNKLKMDESLKESLKKEIEEYESKAKGSINSHLKSFAISLEQLLKPYNIRLRGNVPNLSAGIYEIKMNESDLSVTIYYGHEYEKIANLDMDAEEVAAKIAKIDKTLFRLDNFNEKSFLENLLKAYERYISLHNLQFGEKASMKDFLGEFVLVMQKSRFYVDPIKKNYKEYSRLQFSADLSKLKTLTIGNNRLFLMSATRAYTSKRSDFVWIPQDRKGDGYYCSHLYFKKI